MTLKATRRALYRYVCANCQNKRYSFKYDNAAELQICRKCRREMPAENQPSLFVEAPFAVAPAEDTVIQTAENIKIIKGKPL